MPVSQVDLDKCIGCGTCVESCPMDVFRLDTRSEYRNQQSPCHLACPLGLRQREYHDLVEMGAFDQAARIMWSCHPLPAITGRICPHPCESECARVGIDEAVNIRAVEQYLGDLLLTMDPATLRGATPNTPDHAAIAESGDRASVVGNDRVAVVGSGPAGLAAAYFLTLDGFGATVFEKADELGGVLRTAVPSFRLPVQVLDAQIDFYRRMGIEFRTRVRVGIDVTLEDLRNQGFAVIVAATGASRPARLLVPGGNAQGIVGATEFLEAAKQGADSAVRELCSPPGRDSLGSVAVIGGGSVALDAARTAVRLGARRVSVICLECLEPGTKDSMPALEEEIGQALEEGVAIYPSRGVDSFAVVDNRVGAVHCVQCLSVRDPDGRFNPACGDWVLPEAVEAQTVILAIGQTADATLVPAGFGTDALGFIVVDEVTAQAASGLFACGEAVSGASTVVAAAAAGKKVASLVGRYLKGEALVAVAEPARRAEEPPRGKVESVARVRRSLLPAVERRRAFAEVQGPFCDRDAQKEAGRCLTCGSRSKISYLDDCQVCRLCEHYCPTDAIAITDGALLGSLHGWDVVELGR